MSEQKNTENKASAGVTGSAVTAERKKAPRKTVTVPAVTVPAATASAATVSAPAGVADAAALEKAAAEVAGRLAAIAEQEKAASETAAAKKKPAIQLKEVKIERNAFVPNIAKTQAQIEAESKLAHDPELQEFVDKVLKDEVKTDIALSVARKKNKRDEEFARQLALAKRYTPDVNIGLTEEQVTERKQKGLINQATNSNARTYKSIFVRNIVTFFNLLCIAVAAALIVAGRPNDLFFLVIMAANTILSIVQEIRSKRTIDRLSLISAPVAVVKRGGELVSIPVNEVVLDDIIFLENGKQIPTDCVICSGEAEVNESMITGESVSIAKKQDSTMYGGSFVTSGSCYARADKVGNANYIESLSAFAKKYKRAKSEIMSSLKTLITVIGVAIIPLSAVLYLKNYSVLSADFSGMALMSEAIPITAGAIIGMIPSGMFLLTSIALSLSVIKLAKNNVLVQDLYCIEMLARVNVLCLDKTGTITDGTMNVHDVIEFRNNNETGFSLGNIIGSMLSATGDNNQTAVALINKFGYSKALKPASVLAFSSQRKFSAVSFENCGTIIMGAPEFIIRDMGVKLETLINEKAKEGLRVIMIAYSPGELKGDKVPAGRKPLALVVIEDHVREDAVETLGWFRDNGVQIKVISGDNPVTVSEVATRVGIAGAQKYVSLDGLTDPEVVELANQYTVFGRVTPEQKRLLIKSIKAKGNSVAMTGDGVNDILALKEADCSVAIASGSEAARNVSHMVLLDSNFSNMPAVVNEGRRVVNNIQKSSSLFLMKTIFSVLLTLLVLLLPGLAYPLSPSNMLPMELFIIGISSVMLTLQNNNSRFQGKFMFNILKNALPAGLTLLLCFLVLYMLNLSNINGAERLFSTVTAGNGVLSEFSTAAMLAVTFAGSVMLFKVCLPVDTYRVAVWLIATAVTLLFCVFLGSFLNLAQLTFTQVLVIIVIVESSYALVSLLQATIAKIKIN
jgi:cation-transporting ATPase E